MYVLSAGHYVFQAHDIVDEILNAKGDNSRGREPPEWVASLYWNMHFVESFCKNQKTLNCLCDVAKKNSCWDLFINIVFEIIKKYPGTNVIVYWSE